MSSSSSRQLELLYDLAMGAARATSLSGVLEASLATVCKALDVTRASILLFDEAGTMRFRAWRGLSDGYRAAVDGHSPWARDETDPQPIAVADARVEPSLAAYRDVLDAEGIRSLAFVPLVHERTLLGKFMVYGEAPRELDADAMRLAMTVAGQIAGSVARQSALDAAARRINARERLVAIVAHDLRNPLGVAQLKLQSMTRRVPPGAEGDKLRKDLELLTRSTANMNRVIAELVDVAAIEAGRLQVERVRNRARDLAADAIATAAELAEKRNLHTELRSALDGEEVLCERARIAQVFGMLLANAVRFSPENGVVTIEAMRDGADVVFAVSDEGPGIAASERETVFERWLRVAGETEDKKFIGTGLFIARGLVHAHGGRIWVDPEARAGARVAFTLPCA